MVVWKNYKKVFANNYLFLCGKIREYGYKPKKFNLETDFQQAALYARQFWQGIKLQHGIKGRDEWEYTPL